MTASFPLLRQVEPQHLQLQDMLRCLGSHGIATPLSSPPRTPCLRFRADTLAGQLTCRVQASTWSQVHLPGLSALDWSGMDHSIVEGLVSNPRPLQFDDHALSYQQVTLLPMHDAPPCGSLPVAASAEGPVWIESLRGEQAATPVHAALPWQLPVPITLQLGRLPLTLRRLRRLRVGDIVLLPRPLLRAWRGSCPLFDFFLHPDALTVTTVHSPDHPTDAALPAHRHDAQDGLDLAQLPLELEITLCRMDMSVAELAGLQDGSVVALPEAAYQRVQLVHNGRCVAVGELVQVGERLGVQLAQVPRLT